MKRRIIITDSGRKECGYLDEHQDCTVRALAALTGATYTDAHTFFKIHGRRNNRPVHIHFLSRQGQQFYGYEFEKLPRPHSTVKHYIADHPLGKYMVVLNNHVFTVIDGIIYDLHKLKHLVNRHVESIIVPHIVRKRLTNKMTSP